MITHSKYPCKKCAKYDNCTHAECCPKWANWFVQIWNNLQHEYTIIKELRGR